MRGADTTQPRLIHGTLHTRDRAHMHTHTALMGYTYNTLIYCAHQCRVICTKRGREREKEGARERERGREGGRERARERETGERP